MHHFTTGRYYGRVGTQFLGVARCFLFNFSRGGTFFFERLTEANFNNGFDSVANVIQLFLGGLKFCARGPKGGPKGNCEGLIKGLIKSIIKITSVN